MNSLSWLLYAADVVGGLGSFLVLIAFTAGLSAVLSFCFIIISVDLDVPDQAISTNRKILKAMVITFLVTALINTIIPSKETVYAIAASEMGEKAMAIVIVIALIIGLIIMAVMGMSQEDHKAKPHAENKGSHPGDYYYRYKDFRDHSERERSRLVKQAKARQAYDESCLRLDRKVLHDNRQKATRGTRLYPVR